MGRCMHERQETPLESGMTGKEKALVKEVVQYIDLKEFGALSLSSGFLARLGPNAFAHE